MGFTRAGGGGGVGGGPSAAENVAFTPAGNVEATDVQAAIEEVDASKLESATDVVQSFAGIPDGTKFLKDDGTLAAPDSGPSLPTGGVAGQVLEKQSGTDGDADWVAPPSGLLAFLKYSPASNSSKTINSSTAADVDATNLAITFTVPEDGAVIVVLSGVTIPANSDLLWLLRDESGTIANTEQYVSFTQNGNYTRVVYRERITGLTPGAELTWKWGHRRGGGSGAPGITVGTSAAGAIPAIMEVWAGNS